MPSMPLQSLLDFPLFLLLQLFPDLVIGPAAAKTANRRLLLIYRDLNQPSFIVFGLFPLAKFGNAVHFGIVRVSGTVEILCAISWNGLFGLLLASDEEQAVGILQFRGHVSEFQLISYIEL